MTTSLKPFMVFVAASVGGCAGNGTDFSALPAGAGAYAIVPAASATAPVGDYQIGALDVLDVTVFEEPDLTVKGIVVDASGRITLPLIGSVSVAGKTTTTLSKELAALYAVRYLRDPQVAVTVTSSVSQKVAVQGEVAEPGVYDIKGPTTLLGVLSLAKGETDVSALDQVVVFRTIDGKRMGAMFDVRAIRSGVAEDPQIQGNDMVVVGESATRRFWRNVISASPIFNVFRPIVM